MYGSSAISPSCRARTTRKACTEARIAAEPTRGPTSSRNAPATGWRSRLKSRLSQSKNSGGARSSFTPADQIPPGLFQFLGVAAGGVGFGKDAQDLAGLAQHRQLVAFGGVE